MGPDDIGWESALDQMTGFLERGEPFCHVRFGDGELNAACGIYDPRPNCDGIVYTDEIGRGMRWVLQEMRMRVDDHFIPGGTCVADVRHAQYLKSIGYRFTIYPFRPDGWVPCHVIVEGVGTLRTLPMIQNILRAGKDARSYLVGSRRLAGACESSLIEVSDKAINDVESMVDKISRLSPGSLVMYCAGTPGKVMAWNAWKARPDITHLDMGHFFDRAYGRDNRMWHDTKNPRRDAYDRYFTKLIRSQS